MQESVPEEKKNPLREIVQPFIDLARAPRTLWGVNLGYVIEGMVYFGMLGYLAMYFNGFVGLNDVHAGYMVGVLTWGITLSMFFFGGIADKWGIRFALIAAFWLMVAGRTLLSAGPTIGLAPDGLGSGVHMLAMTGILLVVLGYGMYQPAAYATVRQVTTEKTAAMGYAMLYALMNLGGYIPTYAFVVRERVGIDGSYWVYTGFTVLALVLTYLILSRKTVAQAIAQAKAARAAEQTSEEPSREAKPDAGEQEQQSTDAEAPRAGKSFSPWRWLRNHPLANPKFSFFIFALIPVQTLFAHNWLTLPMYVERAYRDSWVGQKFEIAVNLNPILIFLFVPIITAITQKRKVYNMMILGTFVMAAPTFLLALGPSPKNLFSFLVIMTVGEAMWQPRFLQYAAEIAPEGRTGAYMGVAQFPWFLTKVITSLYSGWFLTHYCPKEGHLNTEFMWLIYALIAMSSTAMLLLAYNWLGRGFKTKAA